MNTARKLTPADEGHTIKAEASASVKQAIAAAHDLGTGFDWDVSLEGDFEDDTATAKIAVTVLGEMAWISITGTQAELTMTETGNWLGQDDHISILADVSREAAEAIANARLEKTESDPGAEW